MVLRSFVKINLLFRIMDQLKHKSPIEVNTWVRQLHILYLYQVSANDDQHTI